MNKYVWLLMVSLVLTSNVARAQFFIGPSSSGCGSSGRAGVDAGEAAFLNPAAIAFVQRYNVSLLYGVSDHPVNGSVNEWGASIVDGTSETAINGGLTYVRRRTDLPSGLGVTQQDWQVAFAGFLHRKLAIGLAGHRLSDELLSSTLANDYTQWNGHLGLLYVPVHNVGIGLVSYDFLPGADLPVGVKVVPTLALGVNFIYEKFFRARLDLVRPQSQNPGNRINIAGGIETFLLEEFVLRFGGHWRETHDQTYATVGLGYAGPRLSFDYSFQKDVRIAANSRHQIDLWLPF